ncbi:MAG TPA: hypothetical protein VHL78_01120 [Actinomycetota bacterium]|nr:hypothetical protein [Actinomycetota bacterium]
MADIEVRSADPGETSTFAVRVSEGGGHTEHEVTLSESDAFNLASGYPSKEEFIRACFEFLLEREPKESILRRFDVSVISRYFPEFEERIRR